MKTPPEAWEKMWDELAAIALAEYEKPHPLASLLK
jgi:hypothetical protein